MWSLFTTSILVTFCRFLSSFGRSRTSRHHDHRASTIEAPAGVQCLQEILIHVKLFCQELRGSGIAEMVQVGLVFELVGMC